MTDHVCAPIRPPASTTYSQKPTDRSMCWTICGCLRTTSDVATSNTLWMANEAHESVVERVKRTTSRECEAGAANRAMMKFATHVVEGLFSLPHITSSKETPTRFATLSSVGSRTRKIGYKKQKNEQKDQRPPIVALMPEVHKKRKKREEREREKLSSVTPHSTTLESKI